MEPAQIKELLEHLEDFCGNLERIAVALEGLNENLDRLIGSTAADRPYLRVLDVGRE